MPSFKTVHRTVLKFTYAERLTAREISLTAVSDEGAALDPPPFFARKRWTKKPVIVLLY